jgi:hypothetical protein
MDGRAVFNESKRAASFEEVRLNTTGIRVLPHLINE